MFGQPLTDSWFPGRDGEKRPPVTAAGAHTWPAMANAETNRDTQNARNVGQMESCGSVCAVNRLRGNRREEKIWLPKRHAKTNSRLENSARWVFSSLLTTRGNSEMRPSRMDASPVLFAQLWSISAAVRCLEQNSDRTGAIPGRGWRQFELLDGTGARPVDRPGDSNATAFPIITYEEDHDCLC
jgi:hypothetical protein